MSLTDSCAKAVVLIICASVGMATFGLVGEMRAYEDALITLYPSSRALIKQKSKRADVI